MSNDFLNSFFGVKQKPQRKRKTSESKKEAPKSSIPKGSVPYKNYYFLDIKKSKGDKKYDAIFMNSKTGKNKIVSFGKKGEKDYTQHNNKDLLEFYDFKHKKKENWNDLMSSAALNKYILWNKKTLESSIRDYKSKLKR